MVATASSCLVTEEHEFLPEVQIPTRISSTDATAPRLGEWLSFPSGAKTLQLKLELTDPNIHDPLYYRVTLEQGGSGIALLMGCAPKTEGEETVWVESAIEPTGNERRELTIPIERADLQTGCYRVSVVITSAFDLECENIVENLGRTALLPDQTMDVARASWWVLAYMNDEDELNDIVAQCLPLARD